MPPSNIQNFLSVPSFIYFPSYTSQNISHLPSLKLFVVTFSLEISYSRFSTTYLLTIKCFNAFRTKHFLSSSRSWDSLLRPESSSPRNWELNDSQVAAKEFFYSSVRSRQKKSFFRTKSLLLRHLTAIAVSTFLATSSMFLLNNTFSFFPLSSVSKTFFQITSISQFL